MSRGENSKSPHFFLHGCEINLGNEGLGSKLMRYNLEDEMHVPIDILSAERHAKHPCVTVSVDDISFDRTVRSAIAVIALWISIVRSGSLLLF